MDGLDNMSHNISASLSAPLNQMIEPPKSSGMDSMVPDISVSSVADEFRHTPDVEDLLAITGTAGFGAFISEITSSPNSNTGKPPLEHTSSLDSLVSILQALPRTDDPEKSGCSSQNEPIVVPEPTNSDSSHPGEQLMMTLSSLAPKIWDSKPPINRAHSGFTFKLPLIAPSTVAVPGIPSDLKRVPKPPVLVKVKDKFAAAAQRSFTAVASSGWIDEDGSDSDDDETGNDQPAPIRLIAKSKAVSLPHVQSPMPNSKEGIVQRVKELQAKLLGPVTRLGPNTPLLPQINELDPLFSATTSLPLTDRALPASMTNPTPTEDSALALSSMTGVAAAAATASGLIKRRKTDVENDLLEFEDLDRLIDENTTFGHLFGDGLGDPAPPSDTILGLDSNMYDDLLVSFDASGE